ncbi:hypothetical protein GGTG_11269 [Gaeumannomyces tritici R3-111a-1]|uniref:Uncharacterized protein n=1 Tax=Gaeumannomyces tritici (strain R3-111a-1) TaxID=644352 RepID=J3PCQ1_GAET3|nr:hypothetical protein GGTG_11269 [Gaeumannomyces tritici R3-111a-1]EJT72021.1 hypothetical protein GGTG_11269 [Gaeumannomyces tritici R3-111a-1]
MPRHDGRDDEGFRDSYYDVDGGRPSGYHLQPPAPSQQRRPRSVPPPSAAVVERSYMMTPATRSNSRTRSRGRDRSRSRSRSRSHSRCRGAARDSHSRGRDGPVEKAERAVKNSFTSSNSGLGIGILGAIVGGLAARHASDSAPKHRHSSSGGHHHHGSSSGSSERERDQRMLMSTLVGAAVGGLGANALERRLEINREREDEARGRAGGGGHHHHHHHHHRHHDDEAHHHHHSHHRRHHHSRHDDIDHVYDDERPVRRRRSLDDPERRQYRPLDYRP